MSQWHSIDNHKGRKGDWSVSMENEHPKQKFEQRSHIFIGKAQAESLDSAPLWDHALIVTSKHFMIKNYNNDSRLLRGD